MQLSYCMVLTKTTRKVFEDALGMTMDVPSYRHLGNRNLTQEFPLRQWPPDAI
jgi:hypothetical protein